MNSLVEKKYELIDNDIKYIISEDLPWNQLFGKSILVSGANGFLPAYMVETLMYLNKKFQANIIIYAMVRNRVKAEKRFSRYLDSEYLRIIENDVCKKIEWDGIGIDYIIHAASQASPKYYGIDPVGTLMANTIGTANMLELAKIKNIERFLYFSSGEIYGIITDNRLITEKDYGYLDPTDLRSCYAESKRMGENMCISWNHQYDLNAVIVRPFHTYGPGMLLDDGRVFADFVRDVVEGIDITINSDGSARRCFCYLADATKAFFTVLLRGNTSEAYNVSSGIDISIKELAEIIAGIYPERNISVQIKNYNKLNGYIKSPIAIQKPSIDKILKLGWKPSIDIEEGFKRTIEYYIN